MALPACPRPHVPVCCRSAEPGRACAQTQVATYRADFNPAVGSDGIIKKKKKTGGCLGKKAPKEEGEAVIEAGPKGSEKGPAAKGSEKGSGLGAPLQVRRV